MNNINVLIVDDEPGIRRLIKDFLARENMNIIEPVMLKELKGTDFKIL